MKPNTLYAIITGCLTLLFLTVLLIGYHECSEQNKRREACLKGGTSAEDCRRLFPVPGQAP